LHIEKGVDYPSTLITAGMNDPKVIVWLPAKFAAKLQACQQANKPILFFIKFPTPSDWQRILTVASG